jgi:hypothetical protein
MPVRTKGRAKFEFRGRQFVWWVDGDYWLRRVARRVARVPPRRLGCGTGTPHHGQPEKRGRHFAAGRRRSRRKQ